MSFFPLFKLGKRANHFRRIARDDDIGWHVLGHHAAISDDASITDRHAGADDCLAADPHIVADRDGFTQLLRATQFGFDRMRCRVNVNARSDEHIVPEPNLSETRGKLLR